MDKKQKFKEKKVRAMSTMHVLRIKHFLIDGTIYDMIDDMFICYLEVLTFYSPVKTRVILSRNVRQNFYPIVGYSISCAVTQIDQNE